MKLPRIITVIPTVVIVIFACLLHSPVSAVFMDLERSIKELQQLVDRTSPGIVMIVAYDDSGTESGRGSGFFIDRDGRIITNASVIEDAYSAEVFSKSNYYDNVIVLGRNENLDFALIQVKANNEVPLELDFEYKIKPGERVIVIGRSSELKKTVSEGLISSVSKIEESSELVKIKTTTPLLSYRTSKDGPLLNMQGKVIGITSTAIAEEQELDEIPRMPDYEEMKAITLKPVKQLLSEPGEEEYLHPAKSKIWTRWFIKTLKSAVLTGFITLYTIGFPKLMAIAFAIVVVISIIQWLYLKLKKTIFSKSPNN